MISFAGYKGSRFYVTGTDAEKPTEADRINTWRELSGAGSESTAVIKGSVTDGDGYTLKTDGEREQDDVKIELHYSDKPSVVKLNGLAKTRERCKIWFAPIDIVGWDESDVHASLAFIYKKEKTSANSQNSQGAIYTFAQIGAPIEWDGTVG